MENKSKYKVIPNLSLKGIEIQRRLNNRTLIMNPQGNQYNLEEKIEDARRMTKADLELAYRDTFRSQKHLTEQLNNMNHG